MSGRRLVRRVVLSFAGLALFVVLVGIAFVARPLSFLDAKTAVQLRLDGVHSQFLVVDGLRLHYFEASPHDRGGGTPLLLIHGLGARAQEWAPLIPGLVRAGFHVYAPDLPGYGESDKPDIAYSITQEEDAIVSFLDAVHLKQTDVAGWSMGGWIALKLAADHPQIVEKLVLYDSAGIYFPRDYETSLFTPNDRAGVDRLFAHLTPKPVTMPGFLARDLLRRMAKNGWVIRRNVNSMTAGRDLMEFRLGEIRAPTLVLWGAQDKLIPSTAGQRMAAGIHGARFLAIPGCGHLLPAECSAAVLPPTVDFLRESTPPASEPAKE